MRYLAALLSLTVALSGATALAAPSPQTPPTVESFADVDRVTVGDRVNYTVVVRHPADTEVELPRAASLLGDLEVIETRPLAIGDDADGSKVTQLNYVLVAFRTGPLTITPPVIPLTQSNGVRQELTGSPLPIQVDSVLPPDQPATELRDLKPQIAFPEESAASIAPILIGVGVAAAILLVAAVWLRRRSRIKSEPAPVDLISITPEETARAELDRIAELGLGSQGRYREYYSSIAVCIRHYITERYGFAAVALTTPELEARMVRLGLNRWQARLVGGLLSECDDVVYARYTPAPERAKAVLTMAYEITEMGAPSRLTLVAPGEAGKV